VPIVDADATDVASAAQVVDDAFKAAEGDVDVLVVAVGLLGTSPPTSATRGGSPR